MNLRVFSLRLVAHPLHAVVHVLPVRASPHQQTRAEGQRIEHAQTRERRHHAEHQHAAVGPLHTHGDLAGPADRLGLQIGQRLDLTEAGAHLTRVDPRHLDRLETGFHEGARHVLGQRLGALVRPDEVVPDCGGDRVLQLGADLGPVLRRVAGVDLLLDVLADDPETATQIVVDIRGEIGDSVVENLLPQRGLLQRLGGLLLAPLQIDLQPVADVRIVQRRQLCVDRQRQMFGGRTDLGDDLIANMVVLPG